MIAKEQIEKWYSDTGGDPWGTDEPFVRDRLRSSLEFIQRFVSADFTGSFVEMGAFDGSFTVQLAYAFPRSQVIANDISETAIDKARRRAGALSNVTFDTSDVADFSLPVGATNRPIILTMMEMLYYTPHEHREAVLTRLLNNVPGITSVFISGPIQGDTYFKEDALLTMFANNQLELVTTHTLNTTDAFRDMVAVRNDWIISTLEKVRPRRLISRLHARRWEHLKKRYEALAPDWILTPSFGGNMGVRSCIFSEKWRQALN